MFIGCVDINPCDIYEGKQYRRFFKGFFRDNRYQLPSFSNSMQPNRVR